MGRPHTSKFEWGPSPQSPLSLRQCFRLFICFEESCSSPQCDYSVVLSNSANFKNCECKVVLCICLSVYICVCLCICVCLSACMCVSVSVYVCLSKYMSVCLSVCAYVSLSVYMCLSAYMCVCLGICVSVCLSVHLCGCLFLSVSAWFSVCAKTVFLCRLSRQVNMLKIRFLPFWQVLVRPTYEMSLTAAVGVSLSV